MKNHQQYSQPFTITLDLNKHIIYIQNININTRMLEYHTIQSDTNEEVISVMSYVPNIVGKQGAQ